MGRRLLFESGALMVMRLQQMSRVTIRAFRETRVVATYWSWCPGAADESHRPSAPTAQGGGNGSVAGSRVLPLSVGRSSGTSPRRGSQPGHIT